jgi:lipopolysaccharide/colanic/teichoic acid biosynthesis glycosyltransferase
LPIEKLYPDLVQREESRRIPRAIQGAIDVLGSSMALVLLSPILLGVALALKLSSPGPALFRQTRIGQYRIPFTFLKFRSMYTGNDPRIHIEYVKQFIGGKVKPDASRPNGRVYKVTEDPRLTSLGRLLRKTSLDELPQFLNVLRGDMSVVGPRPPISFRARLRHTVE